MATRDHRQPARAKLSDRLALRARFDTAAKGRRQVIWDAREGLAYVRGLGLALYAAGERSWIVRVPAPHTAARYRYVTLGRTDEMSCDDAREAARQELLAAKSTTPTVSAKGLSVLDATRQFRADYRTAGKGRRIDGDYHWTANLERLQKYAGKRQLADIRTADLQGIVETEKLPMATARKARSMWATFFEYALAERWIPTGPNPAKRVNVKACEVRQGKKARMLSMDEIKTAIATAARSRSKVFASYVYLLALTGHRPGELARARWEDAEGGQITVRNTKRRAAVTLPPVSLPEVAAELERLREITGGQDGLFCSNPGHDSDGDKAYKYMWERWAWVCKKEPSLKGISLSHFRSSVASHEAGQEIRAAIERAAKRLAHANPQVTKDHYIAL